MEQEYTQEESDSLILQEMWLADDNSTINQEEEIEEVEVEETEVEETETETIEDDEEEQDIEVASKPKKWIAKVLHQRNEARKEAETFKSQVQELQEKLDKLSSEWDYGTEEYIQTLVAKSLAEKEQANEQINDFFDENPWIREYKKEIMNYAKADNLSLEKATKLYLAEHNPAMLLDVAEQNKQKSKMYWTPSFTPKKLVKWEFTYTDKEFETLAKKGVLTF